MHPINYPGTGWASVSCTTPSGTQCYNWTIAPNTAEPANATVAFLFEFGHAGLIYIGSYYNTYRVDVSRP
jgi:hypothetical protein